MKTETIVSPAGALNGLESLFAELEKDTKTEAVVGPIESDNSLVGQDLEPQKPAPVKETKPKVKAEKKPAPKKEAKPAEKKAKPAPKKEAKPVKPVVAEAPKEEKPKRVYFGQNRIGRLQHKLGAEMSKALLLVVSDVDLDPEAAKLKADANAAEFKTWAKKVQMRATNVIEYVSGKSANLNNVATATLRLLARERKITMGAEGNLFKMLSASYTPDSARAMGASTMGMMEALQIVKKDGAHSFVPNEQSSLLALLSDKLLLSFVDVEGALAAVVKTEAKEAKAAKKEPAAA